MATPQKVRTFCPHCRARYEVPAVSVGHTARCVRCKQPFDITVNTPKPSPPTEEEILRWLNEGMEDYDVPKPPSGGATRRATPMRSDRVATPPANDAVAPSRMDVKVIPRIAS